MHAWPHDGALTLARVRLGRVAQHPSWFADHYLSAEDRRRAMGLAVTKRRIDFIGGRVAARRACRAFGMDAHVAIDDCERVGAPLLVDHDGVPLADGVSISHGAGWAVAAVARAAAVGVDVERIEPRHPAFLDEAFAAGELAAFASVLGADGRSPLVVTVAWSAKEACLKLQGIGLRASLRDFVVRPEGWLDHDEHTMFGYFGVDSLRWLRPISVSCAARSGIDKVRLGVWSNAETALVLALRAR